VSDEGSLPEPPPPPPPPNPVTEEPTPGSHWLRVGLMALALVVLVRYTGWWGLAIVAGLVAMIFLHELGHFIMAKRAGMKVTEFFIGFGPRLWSFRRGETEYGFKAIPAGAYVKIIGMSMAEEVDPDDEARTYRAQPFWQRFGVAVAGSTMHFIQALVLIFVILVFSGAPGGALARPQAESNVTQIGDVYAHCPAAEAGIRPDDEVIAIDGHRLEHIADLGRLIAPLANTDADFLIRRNGELRHTTVHIVPRDSSPGANGMLGVRYGPKPTPLTKTGPVRAVPATLSEFGYLMTETIPAFFKAFSPSNLKSYGNQVVNAREDRAHADSTVAPPATTVLAGAPGARSSDGAVTTDSCVESMGGEAAFKSTSGESSSAEDGRFLSIVGIFNIGNSMASSGGIADLLFLFVIVNIFIGVFNLIPMLPFDGGHVVIAVYEKIQEWRKGTGQRYYSDLNKLLPVVYVMILLLGLLFVSSLYLDIANPVSVK
jgi:membrane-associated protease RseP (regulator of RpoE activity)